MSTTFLTGSTGYIGSYVANLILREHPSERLAVLVRAKSTEAARKRLWKSLQMHMSFDEFVSFLPRFDIYLGDLTSPDLGLDADAKDKLVKSASSVLHVAASLNRKSSKTCFNVNLRGTLSVIKLARAMADTNGLRRFSDVSTVAVCGTRENETVNADDIVDWSRSDYDPYARTKKFCEHMVHELLPEVPKSIFRPSIVLGDSRTSKTTQFDMVRAFAGLAYMRVLPFDPDWRADIVPADYVSKGIVHVHMADKPKYEAYNLSSGVDSLTYREIVQSLRDGGHKPRMMFAPKLERTVGGAVEALMSTPRKWGLAPAASLMKVFWPYLTFNTVFDNSHIVEELGHKPRPFSEYGYPLLRFAVDGKFEYPYVDWPADGDAKVAAAL
jgi:thioester reductase-like protein